MILRSLFFWLFLFVFPGVAWSASDLFVEDNIPVDQTVDQTVDQIKGANRLSLGSVLFSLQAFNQLKQRSNDSEEWEKSHHYPVFIDSGKAGSKLVFEQRMSDSGEQVTILNNDGANPADRNIIFDDKTDVEKLAALKVPGATINYQPGHDRVKVSLGEQLIDVCLEDVDWLDRETVEQNAANNIPLPFWDGMARLLLNLFSCVADSEYSAAAVAACHGGLLEQTAMGNLRFVPDSTAWPPGEYHAVLVESNAHQEVYLHGMQSISFTLDDNGRIIRALLSGVYGDPDATDEPYDGKKKKKSRRRDERDQKRQGGNRSSGQTGDSGKTSENEENPNGAGGSDGDDPRGPGKGGNDREKPHDDEEEDDDEDEDSEDEEETPRRRGKQHPILGNNELEPLNGSLDEDWQKQLQDVAAASDYPQLRRNGKSRNRRGRVYYDAKPKGRNSKDRRQKTRAAYEQQDREKRQQEESQQLTGDSSQATATGQVPEPEEVAMQPDSYRSLTAFHEFMDKKPETSQEKGGSNEPEPLSPDLLKEIENL